ncbi:MAG: hypothetical protein KBF12_07095, partial [Sebaldella sp.]|nr:hypothetical protein [Sebaldella sp.]
KKLKKEIDKTIYDQKKPMAEKAIKRKKVEVFQKKPDYSKSPGLLNSEENKKDNTKKENKEEAANKVVERMPEKSKNEVIEVLTRWGVTPDPNGRIEIISDGDVLFRVNDYDSALGAFWALTSSEGLGMNSGGAVSLQEIAYTKNPGNYSLDFSGGAINLEIQAVAVGEGLNIQNKNIKLEEYKNLSNPTKFNLNAKDVNLSDFTQKGGKIDNFVEGIKGKNYNELETLFDKELVGNLGYTKAPMKTGEGVKYQLPNGKSIMLEKGFENYEDITHRGPYIKLSGYKNSSLSDEKGIIRVPLEGNPALK